jgi:hypothetical protein
MNLVEFRNKIERQKIVNCCEIFNRIVEIKAHGSILHRHLEDSYIGFMEGQ